MKLWKDNRGLGKGMVFIIIVALLVGGFFGFVYPELQRKMVKDDKENVAKIVAAVEACTKDEAGKKDILTSKTGVENQFTIEEAYFTADGSKDTSYYAYLRKALGADFDQKLKSTKKDIIVVIKGLPYVYTWAVYADVVDEAHRMYPYNEDGSMNYKFYEQEEESEGSTN